MGEERVDGQKHNSACGKKVISENRIGMPHRQADFESRKLGGLDQAAVGARRRAVLRRAITIEKKECIREPSVVILRHIRLDTTERSGWVREKR